MTKSLDLFFRILQRELAITFMVRSAVDIIHINGGTHARYSGSNDKNGSVGVGFPASHVVFLRIIFRAGSRKLFRHLRRHVGIEDSV